MYDAFMTYDVTPTPLDLKAQRPQPTLPPAHDNLSYGTKPGEPSRKNTVDIAPSQARQGRVLTKTTGNNLCRFTSQTWLFTIGYMIYT